MAKNVDVIETQGVVEELLPGGEFRVKLGNDHEVTAYLAGRLRRNRIRLGIGDEVKVALTPYDLTKGRITYRF